MYRFGVFYKELAIAADRGLRHNLIIYLPGTKCMQYSFSYKSYCNLFRPSQKKLKYQTKQGQDDFAHSSILHRKLGDFWLLDI